MSIAGSNTFPIAKVLSAFATIVVAGLATVGSLKVTGLTSGRIPFVSTGSVLADSSNLTWDNSLNRLSASNADFSSIVTSTSFIVSGQFAQGMCYLNAAKYLSCGQHQVTNGTQVGLSPSNITTSDLTDMLSIYGNSSTNARVNLIDVDATSDGFIGVSASGTAAAWTFGTTGNAVTSPLNNVFAVQNNASNNLGFVIDKTGRTLFNYDGGSVQTIGADFNVYGNGGTRAFDIKDATDRVLLTVLSNGRVGVSSTAPGALFDVANSSLSDQARLPDGSVYTGTTPGISFHSYPQDGISSNGTNLAFFQAGKAALTLTDSLLEYRIPSTYKLAWSSATDNNSSSDTSWYRNAAGVIRTGGSLIVDGSTTSTNLDVLTRAGLPTNTTINGTSVCLSNGTNCPAAPTLTLTDAHIFVGNASNVATDVAMSGDATLSNTGALTLANSGVSASTYRSLTVDAKGRVTAGTNPTTFSGYAISDTSANLATALTDETGSGVVVFGTSPTFTTGITDPLVIGGTAVGSSLALQSTSGVGSSDFIKFNVGNNGATEAMRIITSGNVGIGDATPAAKFVVGSGDLFQVDSSGRVFLPAGASGGGALALSTTGDTDTGFYFSAANEMRWQTGGSDRMTIDTNGNVGIATTAPGTQFEVAGTGVATLNNASTPEIRLRRPSNTGFSIKNNSGKLAIGYTASDNFAALTNVISVDNSGQVGIGTTSPNTTLEVVGTASTTQLIIGSGTSITGHRSGTASLDFGATAAGTCDTLTITVTGAADGDTVNLGIPNALASSDNYQSFDGYVSSANTVTVKRCNLTNAVTALSDPAAATVRADVWKH